MLALGGLGFIFRKPLLSLLECLQQKAPPLIEHNATPPSTLEATPSAPQATPMTTRSSGGFRGSASSATSPPAPPSPSPPPSPTSSGGNAFSTFWQATRYFFTPKISMPQWQMPNWGRSTTTTSTTSPRRRSVKWGNLIALWIALPTFGGVSAASVDHFANSGRGRQCLVNATNEIISPTNNKTIFEESVSTTSNFVRSENLSRYIKKSPIVPSIDRRIKGPQQNYQVHDLDNKIKTMVLYPTNNYSTFLSLTGEEYLLAAPNHKGIRKVLNVQKNSHKEYVQIMIPGKNQILITQPEGNFTKSLETLKEKGVNPKAILGTGPIARRSDVDNSFINKENGFYYGFGQIGYKYINLKRLNGEDLIFEDSYWLDKKHSIKAGVYSTKTGGIHALNFSGLSNDAIQKAIEQLKANPNVVSISLDAWPLNDEKLYSEASVIKTRSFRVFDKDGNLLGHVSTPAIRGDEISKVAKSIWPDETIGTMQRLDDDYFVKTYEFNNPNPPPMSFDDPLVSSFVASSMVLDVSNTKTPPPVKMEKPLAHPCQIYVAVWKDKIGDVLGFIVRGDFQGLIDKIRYQSR
jgi:hypothetical protein